MHLASLYVGERMNRILRKLWLEIFGFFMALAIAFLAWSLIIPAPMAQAKDAARPDYEVLVSRGQWWVFRPILVTPTAGFIIYPDTRVDPRAYAPQAHALAAQGFLVVIVPMPLNLTIFGSERATQVIDSFPEIKYWAIGGHAQGGVMAASYAYKHPGKVQGLVLWAASPSRSANLSGKAIQVISISASLDGITTPKKVDASHSLLPASTIWAVIVGGNHAQFGWYGTQVRDNPAAISRETQQSQVLQATLDFLKSISK